MSERAVAPELAGTSESAETCERAVMKERAEPHDWAVEAERTEAKERAVAHASAVDEQRAAISESSDSDERPRYSLGYPRIPQLGHHLWEAQQAGWPEHLPHEAWQAMIATYNKERSRASSADHPAFRQGYAPNYAATPERAEREEPDRPQAKARR